MSSQSMDVFALRDHVVGEYRSFAISLLNAASIHGLVSQEVTPFDDLPGRQLNDAFVRFRRRMPFVGSGSNENAFFRYDEMVAAERAETEYKTRLEPPPADPRVAHPAAKPREKVGVCA